MIEEHSSPGSAALLINKVYTGTDIYLPIAAQKKQFVVKNDGLKTIQQIIESVNPNNSQKFCLAKAQVIELFLRLWR